MAPWGSTACRHPVRCSPSVFAVDCESVDSRGNEGQMPFNVTVVDTTKPAISDQEDIRVRRRAPVALLRRST